MKLCLFIGLLVISGHPLRSQNQIIGRPKATQISRSGFCVQWNLANNNILSAGVKWGKTPDMEFGTAKATYREKQCSFIVSHAKPAELYWIQPFIVVTSSKSTPDTLYYRKKPEVFITQSNSSGDIKVYFTKPVDTSVATGKYAVSLPNAIDDTLVAYINRAKKSIDLAVYNFASSPELADAAGALNRAYQRGVKIRVVYGKATNTAINQLDSNIGKQQTKESSALMHNKFWIFDVDSPENAIVWTGSTNYTEQQLSIDANNVIIMQDQSVAKTYLIEFNEMFGSEGLQPHAKKAKFSSKKTDNTPHYLKIGNSLMEVYFSPSDHTNNRILEAVHECDKELYGMFFYFTQEKLAEAILDGYNNKHVKTNIILSSSSFSTPETRAYLDCLGEDFKEKSPKESGIIHHKTLIGNPNFPQAQPFIVTGSHNWTASADKKNDENTIILYNDLIANLYFQEFSARWKQGVVVGKTKTKSKQYHQIK